MKFTTRDRPNDPHGICSAYFGFASQIETVRHAVSILGIRQIEDLVLATSIADAADWPNWRGAGKDLVGK